MSAYPGYSTGYAPVVTATDSSGADTYTDVYADSDDSAARVATSRQAVWSILASLSKVTTSRSASWSVAGKPQSTRAAVYTVRRIVSVTRQATWGTLVPVAVSRQARWATYALQTGATVLPMMRLRVFAANGADLGPLPVPESVSASYVLNDVGALQFSYSPQGAKANLLGQPCELAVEVSPDSGRNWQEPPNSRFLYLADSRDPLSRTDKFTVDTKSYVWRLSKARVLPAGALNADGKRAFSNVTPGTLLKTLFQEAQGRGALAGVTHATFSTTTDSSGAAWAKRLTIAYEPGLDYLAILQNLADQGFVDFRTQGRALQVFNADATMATDRTAGSAQVTFRAGRDLVDAPFRRTWEGLANYAYFAGDNTSYEFVNPSASAPWGRWETFISNGSVSDAGTMAALTQTELSASDGERVEYTRGLDFSRAVSKPMWDYDVGNYVWDAVDGTAPQRRRIRQLTLTNSDRNVLSGNVVLNDRFLEADIRAKRRIEGITNGASSGTGTGGPDSDPTKDTTTPNPPTGLQASSAAYLGPGGFALAQVSLTWQAPTTNTDSTVVDDLDRYEVFERPNVSQTGTHRQVATSTDTDIDRSPYTPGSVWNFSVRAVDAAGHRSALTPEVQITMAKDITPPQAPSVPTVTARLGTLAIYWDGLPSTGIWPPDFASIEVHVSTVNDFTPTTATITDGLYAEGFSVLTGYPYGVPLFVKLVAVDKSGLKSAPSLQATGTPARLVGSDVDPGAITYEQIGFKDPGNIVPDGSFETASYRLRVDAASAAAWGFSTGSSFHGTNAATINAATDPSTFRVLALMSTAERQQILATDVLFMRFAYNATTGANGALDLVVEWLSSSGSVTYSTVTAGTRDGTWRTAAGKVAAPANTVSFRVYLQLSDTGTVGTYFVDAVEVRRAIGTEIIEDAAIGNAQIANLAVNNAKIADLQVGKLTAGTMTADVLMAGRFRTSTSGNRVEFDSTGIRMYRGSTLTGNWQTATGQLRIYNDGDATHTSANHGLQFGDDDGQNLVIDTNELMSRFNGSYGLLNLNREGGQVLAGGVKGGFPVGDTARTYPKNGNHQISLRGQVLVSNTQEAEYNDEFPPFMVGGPGRQHLFMDNNEIGSSSGDGPAALFLNAPRNTANASGDIHHVSPVLLGSNSLAVARFGNYAGGTRSTLLYGGDVNNDLGIRFSGNSDQFFFCSRDGSALKPIEASNVAYTSARAAKHSFEDLSGVLGKIRGAKSQRWKYVEAVEKGDDWHVGPMFDDLPDEVLLRHGDPGSPVEVERYGSTSLPSMVGLLWEGMRLLIERSERVSSASAMVGMSLLPGAVRDVEVTLPKPMPDADYSATATLNGAGGVLGSVELVGVVAQTPASVTVRIRNAGLSVLVASSVTVSVVTVK